MVEPTAFRFGASAATNVSYRQESNVINRTERGSNSAVRSVLLAGWCAFTAEVRSPRLDLNCDRKWPVPGLAAHLGPIRPSFYSFGGLQRQGVDEW
jgi:hypothetical protein